MICFFKEYQDLLIPLLILLLCVIVALLSVFGMIVIGIFGSVQKLQESKRCIISSDYQAITYLGETYRPRMSGTEPFAWGQLMEACVDGLLMNRSTERSMRPQDTAVKGCKSSEYRQYFLKIKSRIKIILIKSKIGAPCDAPFCFCGCFVRPQMVPVTVSVATPGVTV